MKFGSKDLFDDGSVESTADWRPIEPFRNVDIVVVSARMSRLCRVYAARTGASIFAMSARSASMFSNKWP